MLIPLLIRASIFTINKEAGYHYDFANGSTLSGSLGIGQAEYGNDVNTHASISYGIRF